MAEQLCSIGLDVGTTTTQLIVSQLQIENKAGAFSVPEMTITDRQILYKSPVHFTPLLGENRVDGDGVRRIVTEEYRRAGITREDVDTGAIIITGETSRKENARTVLDALSDLAGDFVVATAGPDLESVLAARGAGAVAHSEKTGSTVLHMDIGGGTSNLAWIENGKIVKTGCLNVGGRLVKLDDRGTVTYVSPVLCGLTEIKEGSRPSGQELSRLAQMLTMALEMAAGLRQPTELLNRLWTKEAGAVWTSHPADPVLSFSGGVADCIETAHLPLAFGDIGPVLGQAIQQSRLCQGRFMLGSETIRATVIGAGCHSTQLSGSTVYHRNVTFPIKNLPVVTVSDPEELPSLFSSQDSTPVVALAALTDTNYAAISALADALIRHIPSGPVYLSMEQDAAKALGQALALRMAKDRPLLCLDRLRLEQSSYLDVGAPVGTALPVVIKTLILSNNL